MVKRNHSVTPPFVTKRTQLEAFYTFSPNTK